MKNLSVILSVLLGVQSVYGGPLGDHAGEAKVGREQSPVQNLDSIQDRLAELIRKAIYVSRETDGRLFTGPTGTAEGLKAREDIRSLLEGTRGVDWMVEKLAVPVSFAVYDKTLKPPKYVEEKVDGLGMLVAMASSILQRDGRDGRRLMVKDRFGDTVSMDVATLDGGEYLLQLQEILKAGRDALKKQAQGPVKYTNRLAEDEPAHQVLLWNSDTQEYKLTDLGLHQRWQARKEVAKIIEDPKFAPLLEAAAKEDIALDSDAFLKKFYARKEVRELTHRALTKADPAAVRQELGTAIKRYTNWTPDPNDPKYYEVSYTRLAPEQQVVPVATADEPVIGFSYPDNASTIRLAAARQKGAVEGYTSKNPAEAVPAIRALFQKTGKKVRVLFGGHGNAGFLHGCVPGPNLDAFIEGTRGMVSEVYLLGCNVGDGAEDPRGGHNIGFSNQPNMKHAAREIAVKSKDDIKVYAVDQYLLRNKHGWHLGNGGNLVTVTPTQTPTISVESMISEKPVWAE